MRSLLLGIVALWSSAAFGAPELYDFGATWCAPCKQMAPVIAQFEQAGYVVKKIDIDQQKDLAAKFNVTSIPCFIVVENDKAYGRIVGACTAIDLAHLFDPWRTKAAAQSKAASDNDAIIEAGKRWRVMSISTGRSDPTLMALADYYAKQQAAQGFQDGHRGWDQRMAYAQRALPGYSGFSEITAESLPGKSKEAHADELFYSWQRSPGHWGVANGRCRIFGYAMAMGRNGTCYGVGIVGR